MTASQPDATSATHPVRRTRNSTSGPRSGKRITVHATPHREIDPHLLLQFLLALAERWEQETAPIQSADVFDAAIEDRLSSDGLDGLATREVPSHGI